MREAGRGSCERTSGGGTGHFGHRDAALGGEVVREFRDTRYVRLWYNQRVAAPQWHDVCVVGTTSIQGWTTERMLESQPDYVRARRSGGNLILRGSCRFRTGCTTVPLRARCGRKDSPGRCSKMRGGRGFRGPLRRKRSYLLRAAAGATVRDLQDGGRAGLDEGAGGRWAGSEQKTCLEKARLLVDNLVAPVRNTAADWRAGSAGRQEPFSSAGPAGARQRRIGPRQSDILT